jgi:hypothetical protein
MKLFNCTKLYQIIPNYSKLYQIGPNYIKLNQLLHKMTPKFIILYQIDQFRPNYTKFIINLILLKLYQICNFFK